MGGYREYAFSYQPAESGFEVLYTMKSTARRFAFCTHENDAKAIVEGMKLYVKATMSTYPILAEKPVQLLDYAAITLVLNAKPCMPEDGHSFVSNHLIKRLAEAVRTYRQSLEKGEG